MNYKLLLKLLTPKYYVYFNFLLIKAFILMVMKIYCEVYNLIIFKILLFIIWSKIASILKKVTYFY